MKVTYGIENTECIPSTILTLGSYDGLHLGHQDILRNLGEIKKTGGYSRSAVITFDPHPQEILKKNNSSVFLLTTITERLALLKTFDIDEAIIIPFSFSFSQTPYAEFFEKSLINDIGMKAMVVGLNHAFGKNREGDIEHLEKLASKEGITITEIPPHFIHGVHISSTKIRAALLEGNIQLANKYLGRQYSITGPVIFGDGLGKEFGFPTANIQVAPNKLIPKDGVYSGRAILENGNSFVAAISIGTRPTVTDSSNRVVEALLLDFNGDIYSQTLKIEIDDYLREQIKFDTFDELKAQMKADVEGIRIALK